jgi:hypothetical protein
VDSYIYWRPLLSDMRLLAIMKDGTMESARRVLLPLGLIIVGVLAIITLQRSTDTTYSSATFTQYIDAVQSDFDANNARAEGAPQQQVVAGWATKDALSVVLLQAEETNERLTEIREAAEKSSEKTHTLLTLAILAMCWAGIWLPFGRSAKEPTNESDSEAQTATISS